MSETNVAALVETFANQLVASVEASVAARVQAAIAGVFNAPQARGLESPRNRAVSDTAPVVAIPVATAIAKNASPKAARARKLQGQYLGALKSLTGANRAKVKRAAKEKGVAEAVRLALSIKKISTIP